MSTIEHLDAIVMGTGQGGETYQPVQCSFHDVLEDAAVRGRMCMIRYRDEDDEPYDVTTTIDDVFARNGAEWARLGTGSLIRLDHLDQVDPT